MQRKCAQVRERERERERERDGRVVMYTSERQRQTDTTHTHTHTHSCQKGSYSLQRSQSETGTDQSSDKHVGPEMERGRDRLIDRETQTNGSESKIETDIAIDQGLLMRQRQR